MTDRLIVRRGYNLAARWKIYFVAPTDPVDEFLEVYENSLGHISNYFLLRGSSMNFFYLSPLHFVCIFIKYELRRILKSLKSKFSICL
jgi:hypothetical protein